jgi:hypothetical protein
MKRRPQPEFLYRGYGGENLFTDEEPPRGAGRLDYLWYGCIAFCVAMIAAVGWFVRKLLVLFLGW